MKYIKAEVEVIAFPEEELFMIISTGKRCGLYALIETTDGKPYVCFDVDISSKICYDLDGTLTICSDVVPNDPNPLFCRTVTPLYNEIVG